MEEYKELLQLSDEAYQKSYLDALDCYNKQSKDCDIVDYIEMWYNSRRRHSYLGYLSPKEFEKVMAMKKAA